MKSKDWKIPYEKPEIPLQLLEAGYTPLLSAVLALRGIVSPGEAHDMIQGSDSCIFDPMLIHGMDRAAARIKKAVENRETVAVFGDYDVDGITATCLLTDYLRRKNVECRPYIPDRCEEGYGLNCDALDALKAEGVSLVVTVDCGITAVEEAEYSKRLGMDMVITDHHECKSDAIPDAVAVIDCKQDCDSYPNPHLAGVGMALKLVCACEGNSLSMLARYADLVALGTVADVMPLNAENRQLVRLGLEKLEKSPRPGIAAMLRESAIDPKKLSASVIGYSLAPRLNAAGRLGQADTAAKLLMCEDRKTASELAYELCELNRRRQEIETDIWEEANQILASKPVEDAPIVLASDRWHQGVIGIAASRLSEQYALPAIMICLNGDVGKGSCRSYGGFNLFEALSACSEHLIGFGGHALAAGLNIRADKLDDFRQAITKYYRAHRPEAQPEVECDLLINEPSLLSIDNVRSLDLLEPYGNQNPKPVMCISGALLESARAVGNGRHLRMKIRLGSSRFECIFFSHTAKELGIREGDLLDLAFCPQINEFHGRVSVQLLISGVRKHDCRELCRDILENRESAFYAASRYCPTRPDFVRVWHMLERKEPGGSFEEILGSCPPSMYPERYCICLVAFLEAGLLESDSGKIYGARRKVICGKVNLETTELIQALKASGR
ncbi:MAG: single-stranded-DNA-specific exonuclease RecJ [Candidatus Limivicinus sp.]